MHAGADPNYNTLTGCNALVNTTTFEEFIMEVEIDAVADNDGMGLPVGDEGDYGELEDGDVITVHVE